MSKPVKIILIVAGALVICAIPVILVLLTLAVPAMQKINIKAHQTSAIQSLRLLNAAEDEYNSTYPQHGFACSLASLGGAQSGTPTPEAAQLIGDDLVTGTKAGYTFTLTCNAKSTMKNHDTFLGYRITAVPNSLHHTGNLGYCTDQDAAIKFEPTGGANCTELLQ